MTTDAQAGFLFFTLVALFFYFLPSTMAHARQKRNLAAIFVINLFLGWTLIGWVVALAWAITYEEPRVPEPSDYPDD